MPITTLKLLIGGNLSIDLELIRVIGNNMSSEMLKRVNLLNILVTGGAGFIGRWVVDRLLKDSHHVWVLDDLSNGRIDPASNSHSSV